MRTDPQRTKDLEARATETEVADFRSVVRSLQWLSVQSRPDLAFECNQLQKRVVDLRVRNLQRANRAVREIVFRPLSADAEIVAFHDAGLYSTLVWVSRSMSRSVMTSLFSKRGVPRIREERPHHAGPDSLSISRRSYEGQSGQRFEGTNGTRHALSRKSLAAGKIPCTANRSDEY